jgi:hypothetical protein
MPIPKLTPLADEFNKVSDILIDIVSHAAIKLAGL